MKLIYTTDEYTTGKKRIYYAVYDKDIFSFVHTLNLPFAEMTIDEVGGNKELCKDLNLMARHKDEAGESKYFINNLNEVCENIGWEFYDDFI